jgi:hypothetical protein
VENPESFLVGAKLVRLDIEFQKQAVLGDALELDNAAGCFVTVAKVLTGIQSFLPQV